jgi:hypothetical protein
MDCFFLFKHLVLAKDTPRFHLLGPKTDFSPAFGAGCNYVRNPGDHFRTGLGSFIA